MKKFLLILVPICALSVLSSCGSGTTGGTSGGGGGGGAHTAARFSVNAPATAAEGMTVSFTVTALDASNNVVTNYAGTVQFTSTDARAVLPANTSLTNGTATFSATMKTAGNQTVTVTDTTTASITGTSNSIDVGAQATLSITSGTPPNGTTGKLYDVHCFQIPPCNVFVFGFALEASGGVTPYSWSWVAAQGSSLPPGLGIAGPEFLIGGTPSSAGTYNVVVTVNDSASPENRASANYTIHISNPPAPAIGTTPTPSAGAVTLPYSFAFAATGGLAPLTWSETGALPPGIQPLSPAGVLSGTPTPAAAGSFPITVNVQDSLGRSAPPQNFTIQVFLHGFKAVGSMEIPRTGQAATLLVDGRVLVTGGFNSDAGDLAETELYDETSERFSPAGSMSTARPGHTATLLDHGSALTNGKVLVAGGNTATADLFDPASGSFTPTGIMESPRQDHTATLLSSGKVLVAGGNGPNGPLNTAELFDPASGTFTPTGNLQVARAAQTATLLKDGRVLVTGGYDSNLNSLVSAELFDPSSGTFTLTSNLSTPRKVHTATLLGTGMVLIAGGLDSNSTELSSAELFDPASGTFAPVGPMSIARAFHAATLLNDGTVLVSGGTSANASQTSADLFDPANGNFSSTGSLTTARSSHTATLLTNGTVLVAGGGDINFAALSSSELYQ